MVLIGEYGSKVTSGNRVAIPKSFRKSLGEKLIVTRGFEQHLILVNDTQFSHITEGVVEKPFISGEVREITRFLLGSAFEIEPDGQGRFVLPENLRKYAHIQENVVFLGLNQWVEIWDEDIWNKHLSTLQKHSASIADRLARLE